MPRPDGAVVGADRHRAARRHRVARVENEVHQRQLELAGVDMGRPDRVVDLPLEPHQPAQDRRHQAVHRVGERGQPHGRRLADSGAARRPACG